MNDSKYFNKLLCSFIFIVFATIFIIYGYGIMPDSSGYINMSSGREPFYPIFLFVLRTFFKNCLSFLPEDAYFYAASFFANLLAAFAVCFATLNIKRLFKLNNIITVFIALVILMPFLFSIISSTLRHIELISITTLIWTENLSVPLYYIYFIFLLRYLLNSDIKDYVKAIVLAVILALTRGQMAVLFIVNLFAGIAVLHKNYKDILKSFLVMLASFLIAALIARCYYFVMTGRFIGKTGNPMTESSGVLLAGSENDAELFNDNEIKELYTQIAQEITKRGYRENLYNGGLLNTGYFAEKAHDRVKFDISGPVIYNYLIEKKGMERGLEADIARDKIASKMMWTLLSNPDTLKNYLNIYAGYLADGFIRCVAILHPVLNIYAVFIYITAVFLFFISIKKGLKKEAKFIFLALLSLTGFVTSVSLVIMPSSRYVIYNLPFFYSALIISFINIFKAKN